MEPQYSAVINLKQTAGTSALKSSKVSRSEITVMHNDNRITVKVSASDVASFRAAVNSIMRDIATIDSTESSL